MYKFIICVYYVYVCAWPMSQLSGIQGLSYHVSLTVQTQSDWAPDAESSQ